LHGNPEKITSALAVPYKKFPSIRRGRACGIMKFKLLNKINITIEISGVDKAYNVAIIRIIK